MNIGNTSDILPAVKFMVFLLRQYRIFGVTPYDMLITMTYLTFTILFIRVFIQKVSGGNISMIGAGFSGEVDPYTDALDDYDADYLDEQISSGRARTNEQYDLLKQYEREVK